MKNHKDDSLEAKHRLINPFAGMNVIGDGNVVHDNKVSGGASGLNIVGNSVDVRGNTVTSKGRQSKNRKKTR